MTNSTAPDATSDNSLWKTPLPYMLGVAIIIMALIVFALSDLLCADREDSQNNDRYSEQVSAIRLGHGGESAVEYSRKTEMREIYKPKNSDEKDEKLVVIMAGDDLPSFIAMPASVSAKWKGAQHLLCGDLFQSVILWNKSFGYVYTSL